MWLGNLCLMPWMGPKRRRRIPTKCHGSVNLVEFLSLGFWWSDPGTPRVPLVCCYPWYLWKPESPGLDSCWGDQIASRPETWQLYAPNFFFDKTRMNHGKTNACVSKFGGFERTVVWTGNPYEILGLSVLKHTQDVEWQHFSLFHWGRWNINPTSASIDSTKVSALMSLLKKRPWLCRGEERGSWKNPNHFQETPWHAGVHDG